MKEFYSILISFIFMGIADSIDSAFNNAISIDTIVVCGSLFTIDIMLKSLSEIGLLTYRIERKNESEYLIINLIASFILGFLTFLFRDILVNLFNLTVLQKELLFNILGLYIIYLAIGRTANAIFEIIRLKGKLKLYKKSLIVYYAVIIILDIIAFIITKNIIILFIATMISWVISIIYMLYNLKLDFKLPNKTVLNKTIKYGIPLTMERVLARIGVLVYGILVSNIGTDKYSIHTVCYSVCVACEVITNAYQATLMIKYPVNATDNEKINSIIKIKKQCFSIVILLNYIFCFIYLIIMHGSLPLSKCFPYIIFYSVSVFGLYPYETYKTVCLAQGKPNVLLIGSTVGSIIRITICFLFYKTEFAIFTFGLANALDFYCRSLIFRLCLRKGRIANGQLKLFKMKV